MPKHPLSVTLEDDNLLWLKARVAAGANRSLSDAIDAVVTAARAGGAGSAPVRSVVGSVDIADDDHDLEKADAYVRSAFEQSIARAFLVKEPEGVAAPAGRSSRQRTRRRG